MDLTLQRTVTIKVVVTEEFKNYLQAELNRAIQNLDNQLNNMEAQAKRLVESLKKQGDKTKQQVSAIVQQVNLDRQQQQLAKADLQQKAEEAKNLQLGSEFIQGTVNGWVSINKGDNLYKKLGGVELIVKDGVVQEIKGAE